MLKWALKKRQEKIEAREFERRTGFRKKLLEDIQAAAKCREEVKDEAGPF